MKKGGLNSATENGLPVAGSICIRTGKICHGIEEGILHNDSELIKLGMNALLVWCTILWARDQGSKYLHLGSSHAWCENGAFDFKAGWGAKVVRRKKIYPNWYFASDNLPDSLGRIFNQINFICENNDKFYALYIEDKRYQDNSQELIAREEYRSSKSRSGWGLYCQASELQNTS